ncbi:MAG: hypothetical protein AAF721_42605 [Myxococcota bacterium]
MLGRGLYKTKGDFQSEYEPETSMWPETPMEVVIPPNNEEHLAAAAATAEASATAVLVEDDEQVDMFEGMWTEPPMEFVIPTDDEVLAAAAATAEASAAAVLVEDDEEASAPRRAPLATLSASDAASRDQRARRRRSAVAEVPTTAHKPHQEN